MNRLLAASVVLCAGLLLLAPPAGTGLSDEQRDALLQRLGTTRWIADAPAALFAELGVEARVERAVRNAVRELPERLTVR